MPTPLNLRPQPGQWQPGDAPIPVLVFGSELTLTGVMRILGRAKLPQYALSAKGDFASHSRWYRKPPGGATNLKPCELADFLQALPLEKAVLVPCSDDWLRAVAALPASLARRFPSSLSAAEVVLSMVDKWRFAQLLERNGIPHPRTLLIRSRQQLESLPQSEFDHRIFKPLSSMEFASKHGVKGYLVRDRMAALRLAPQLEYPIMLQEYIPGPPTQSYFIDGFVDRHGQICARFARQRLRMYPKCLGNSSLTASVPLSEVDGAVEALDQLLQAVHYRGVFSAEFKHDPRDRIFKILEINARPWWFVEFAASCGVDVCQLAYRDALGLPVEPVQEYKVGRRCVHLANDLIAFRELHGEGSLSLWSWIQSWLGRDGAVFAWDDLGPAVACAWDLVKGRLRHIGRGEDSARHSDAQLAA